MRGGAKIGPAGCSKSTGPPKAMEVGAALGEGWKPNENQTGRENWEEDTRGEIDNVNDYISQY